jgi:tetratricopeptide (TPR) repeat protein
MMQFKHTRATIPQIAAQLGVHAVMTGSVTRDGDRLRVTIALMEPTPERQLWAETYERHVGDVLTLSNEVAQTAVKNVRVRLTPAEEAQLAQVRPMKPDAQQAYLLGRFFWNKRTKADNERAMQEFQRAIQTDATAARAYAGLADCYIIAIDNGWFAAGDGYRLAKTYATRALELDDNLAEAHATLGMVYRWTLLWTQAEQEFKRSIGLNPGYATAHQWYSIELRLLARFDEAVDEARRALDLDPLSSIQSVFLGNQLYFAGRYAAAAEQVKQTLATAPDFAIAHQILGQSYLQLGDYDTAIQELARATELDGSGAGNLGHAYAVAGNRIAANRILSNMLAQSQTQYVRPFQVALVYVGLGDVDHAMRWIETAYRESEGAAAPFATDPRLVVLSGDPRFQAILRSAGLTFKIASANAAH